MQLPAGYGYRVERGDRWKVGWMFMNHRHTADRVYLQYTVTVSTDPRTKPVTPYWISVSCHRNKIYSVPGGGAANATHRRTRTWTVPKSGRIVAAGAHAHGGALKVSVARPGCGEMLASVARYGTADDPIYHLSPVLHEPAPRSMSVVTSQNGWRVRKGDRLKVTSLYSDAAPHSAVMGIIHLYIASGKARASRCPANPQDVQEHRLAFPGAPGRDAARHPAAVRARCERRRAARHGRPARPAEDRQRQHDGRDQERRVRAAATVGARRGDGHVGLRRPDPPRRHASAYYKRGASYRTKLTTRGEYRIFCSLHPVTMSQTIVVR
jgi:hypothetical protein